MSDLRYTLLTDGSSDRALIPLLTWLLRANGVNQAIQSEWADFRHLRVKPHELAARITLSLKLYPCDLLFVHRDAEGEERENRVVEIRRAVGDAANNGLVPPAICVIPVRMQEAWLLFDVAAIRRAAGNPNGQENLIPPQLNRIEQLPDPKSDLHNLLRGASGLGARRRARLNVHQRAIQVSGFITDFSPLRALPAFSALEADVIQIIEQFGAAV
jgi:hypothetical protein